MTNEEFQRLVLEKLGNLEEGQRNLEEKIGNLEVKVGNLEEGQRNFEEGQKSIQKDIRSITEQTAGLMEFRYEINEKVDNLTEEIRTMEIVTSKNWNDIAKLKAAR